VALPALREADGAVDNFNVLLFGMNGLVGFDGGDAPLLAPRIVIEGEPLSLDGRLAWSRDGDWVPRAVTAHAGLELQLRYLCPPEERGFMLVLAARNTGERALRVSLGVGLCWARVLHSINRTNVLEGGRYLVPESWYGLSVLEYRAPEPRLALAIAAEGPGLTRARFVDGAPLVDAERGSSLEQRCLAAEREIRLEYASEQVVGSGESVEVTYFCGVGLDEIGALASAVELSRVGRAELEQRTARWLAERRRALTPDVPEVLTRRMNENAFFNRFFATGRTLDTEQVVCVTSRSPRYYVSGAYWDRDSLLWSFPSLLALDPAHAREALLGVYGVQRRNFGVHSRYINGAVLEPGFELDQLCAPVLALHAYVQATEDESVLARSEVQEGLQIVEARLARERHAEHALYRTWLLPSDDPWPQRYVTYDNVLVWRALTDLAALARRLGATGAAARHLEQAERVRSAVRQHCVVRGPGGPMFAWSIDLEGGHRLYDEPPGSLLLLPHYGFCGVDDAVWQRTRAWIHSPDYAYSFVGEPFDEVGCAHAKHPWVLAAVNSLLSGDRERAVRFLSNARMDNGIACESVDERTGEARTGFAFATCAGFLAYGLWHALGR
jgi:hypothetical protein